MVLTGRLRGVVLASGLALLLAPLGGSATAVPTSRLAPPAADDRAAEPVPSLTRTVLPQRSSAYLCTGYDACAAAGYPHHGYKKAGRQMWWRMYAGHNCTNYVAYRMVQAGMSEERPWSGSGMAYHWGVAMAHLTDQQPRVGAVAWWKKGSAWAPSSGHVAYVEKVISEDEILVSEDSWGGDFHWRRVVRGTSGWPSGFIHFVDEPVKQLVAQEPPALTGLAEVGSELVASPGTWQPAPAKLGYTWYVGGQPVPGATGDRYTPVPADKGKQVTVEVTARRKGYPAVTEQAPPARVRAGTMVAAAPPSVAGTPEVDKVLELSPGSFTPAPATTTVRWFADGQRLAGADGPQLPLGQHLIGSTLRAKVVAKAEGYRKVVLHTEPVGPVQAGTIELRRPFTVAGRARHGRVLRVVPGEYAPADAWVGYTWLRDGVPVPGVTGDRYPLGDDDLGHRISVQVSMARSGYRDATFPVPAGAPVTTKPVLDVRATGKRRRAVVVVRISAPGVPVPEGPLTVRVGGRQVEGRLAAGRARVVVPDLRPGTRRVRVRYEGTDLVEAARARADVTIAR